MQLAGVGLLLGALATMGLVIGAGAAGPGSGSIVPTAVQPLGTVAHGPFSSGQLINVVVPTNETFSSDDGLNNNNSAINILECSAPDGVVPTNPSACDGNTIQGNTILPATDGSFTYNNYQLYALPDAISLGEGSSGVACGNTMATECILFIGNNQADFTKPHLWSAPFFIAPNADDGGENPGDGSAPATASMPDPGLSTVVASPGTATGNGVDLSTVTVTLLGTGSVPVEGKAVTLTPTSCTPSPCAATVTDPSPDSSGSNGQVAFTLTDSVAQVVTLSAVDSTDSVTLNSTANVTFQAPVVDAAHSAVVASPTTVAAGGSTTVTVTLRDQGATTAEPVEGKTVTLSGSAGSSALITPAEMPNVTNAAGVVTFTVTDPAAEIVTFTATDTTDSNTVISDTGPATVTFGTLAVSPSTSTVTVSNPNPAPLGASGTTAVVTLLTSTGSPVAGKTVSLAASTGTSVTITPLTTPAATDAQGHVSFSLTDTVAETATLTASDTTDGIALTAQPTVSFTSGSPSATASTVTAQAPSAPADGETQVGIFITLNDQFGEPLSGKTITVAGAPTGNVLVHPFAIGSALPGVTNSSGQVQFEADDTHAETVTFAATDTTDSLVLSQTVSVTFTALPADPAAQDTTVKASPTSVAADGKTATTITVTLTDYFGNPIANTSISLKALNGSSTISPSTAVMTNQVGVATFTATDSTAEVVTYQATDTTDSDAVLESEAVVTFGNPPAPPAVAAFARWSRARAACRRTVPTAPRSRSSSPMATGIPSPGSP